MGCCGSGSTTIPPFRYSPNQCPLPREKPAASLFTKLESPKSQGYISSIACSGSRFACGWDTSLIIYDLESYKIVNQFQPHLQNISKCRFLNDGTGIITSSYDRTLKLWNAENLLAPRKTFEGHQMAVATFCLSADQKKLCSGSRDQSVALWDLTTGEKIAEKGIARNTVTCMEWIPTSEETFVQCSEDLTIRIWDSRELKPVIEVPLKDDYFAYSCDVDQSGTKLLTGHYACNEVGCGVLLWDLRKITEGGYVWRFLEHKEAVVQVGVIQKDGKEIAVSASRDAKIKIIKLIDGVELGSYQDESRWPFTSFGKIEANKRNESVVVAGMCKKNVSKVRALKIGEDNQAVPFAGTEVPEE